jgi:hypothetical protein
MAARAAGESTIGSDVSAAWSGTATRVATKRAKTASRNFRSDSSKIHGSVRHCLPPISRNLHEYSLSHRINHRRNHRRASGLGCACASTSNICHRRGLFGGSSQSPPLQGPDFLTNWKGKTLGALFDEVRMTMPFDSPGSLTPAQYADVLAYMLSVNKFPAGEKELDKEPEPMQQIKIEAPK